MKLSAVITSPSAGTLLAGADFKDVAHLDGLDGHLLHVAVLIDEMSSLRCHSHELPYARCRSVLGLVLEQPTRKNERDNHSARVEIRQRGIAPKRVVRAENERDARRQRHECVHVGGLVGNLLNGTDVERLSAEEHVGQSYEQRHLVGQ